MAWWRREEPQKNVWLWKRSKENIENFEFRKVKKIKEKKMRNLRLPQSKMKKENYTQKIARWLLTKKCKFLDLKLTINTREKHNEETVYKKQIILYENRWKELKII